MKYTESELKDIIKEELRAVSEGPRPSYLGDVASMLKDMDEKQAEATLLRWAQFLGRDEKELAQLFSKALEVTQKQSTRLGGLSGLSTAPKMEEDQVEEGALDFIKSLGGQAKSAVGNVAKKVGGAVGGAVQTARQASAKADVAPLAQKTAKQLAVTHASLKALLVRMEKLGMAEAAKLDAPLTAIETAMAELGRMAPTRVAKKVVVKKPTTPVAKAAAAGMAKRVKP